jgi:hypothetical protein
VSHGRLAGAFCGHAEIGNGPVGKLISDERIRD